MRGSFHKDFLVSEVKGLDEKCATLTKDLTESRKEAKALADRIADNPPHALRLSKKLLRESSNSNMNQLHELSAVYNAMLQHTEDHRDRVDDLVARISSRSSRKTKAKSRAKAKK